MALPLRGLRGLAGLAGAGVIPAVNPRGMRLLTAEDNSFTLSKSRVYRCPDTGPRHMCLQTSPQKNKTSAREGISTSTIECGTVSKPDEQDGALLVHPPVRCAIRHRAPVHYAQTAVRGGGGAGLRPSAVGCVTFQPWMSFIWKRDCGSGVTVPTSTRGCDGSGRRCGGVASMLRRRCAAGNGRQAHRHHPSSQSQPYQPLG